MRIVGFGGSLRRGSWNRGLLREAAGMVTDDVELDLSQLDLTGRLPLFDQDIQADEGLPPGVADLKDRLASADGLLLATPEYNWGIPGYLKNAIDWASRPGADAARVFADLPVAIIGAGGFSGTRFAQEAWLPIFQYLKLRPWFGHSLFIDGRGQFDADGRLLDEATRTQLRAVVVEFAAHCRNAPRARRS